MTDSIRMPAFTIRRSRPEELPAIAELVARSFAAFSLDGRERRSYGEAYVPALGRSQPSCDPALDLVAEGADGRLLGQAFYFAYRARLGGAAIRAACLAPISVDPDYQRAGIGSALMRAGLGAVREGGYGLAFLLGHASYYPRFGFRTGLFGRVGIVPSPLAGSAGGAGAGKLRAPRPGDEHALRLLWEACLGDAPLALEPEAGFRPWISWASDHRAVVLERGGEAVAYARYRAASVDPEAPPASAPWAGDPVKLFLAADAAAAAGLLGALGLAGAPPLLPLHPRSAAARRLFPGGFAEVSEPWEAAMAAPLAPEGSAERAAVDAFIEGAASGTGPLGMPLNADCFDGLA